MRREQPEGFHPMLLYRQVLGLHAVGSMAICSWDPGRRHGAMQHPRYGGSALWVVLRRMAMCNWEGSGRHRQGATRLPRHQALMSWSFFEVT
ncbi:hypothetical protein M3J09_010564 [Ascochyta lentis]